MHVPRQQPEPDGQAKACRCVLATVSAQNAQNPGGRRIFKTPAVFSPRARGLCRYRRTQPGVVGAEDIRTGRVCRMQVANTKVTDVASGRFFRLKILENELPGTCTQIYLQSSNTPTALRRPRYGSGPSTPGPGSAWASPRERPPRSLAPALVPKEY